MERLKMDIEDNFLNPEEFKNIQTLLTNPSFPWFLNKGVVEKETDEKNMFQFTHTFWDNNLGGQTSPFLIELEPLINKINPSKLYRIKANLVTRTDEIVVHGYHTDYHAPFKCTTSVFYINTNNGFTVFENGEKAYSLENRFARFDSNLMHSGSSCTDKNFRCVININYDPE